MLYKWDGQNPPPYFCAATETGRDIIQTYYNNSGDLPPHYLEKFLTSYLSKQSPMIKPTKPHTSFEVYVDDYITATHNTCTNHIVRIAKAMLHGIHSIFPPPTITGHSGADPISIKKATTRRRNVYLHQRNPRLEI